MAAILYFFAGDGATLVLRACPAPVRETSCYSACDTGLESAERLAGAGRVDFTALQLLENAEDFLDL